MKETQSLQKSYIEQRRRLLEFEVGDQVLLRVSPTKGIIRFRMTGKLNPRYIRSYPINQCVRKIAYRLHLPAELRRVHNVFHVSQLRKYIPDPSHIITPNPLQLQEDCLTRSTWFASWIGGKKQLRRKIVSLAKVLWPNQNIWHVLS